MTKKFWKRVILALVSILVLLGIGVYIYIQSTNEDLPKGIAGPEADQMAQTMMNALNIEAWNATDYVEWSFRDSHHFQWCKAENLCTVKWKNNEVDLNLTDRSKSLCKIDGVQTAFDQGLIDDAWRFFCNDSFWLIAPFKVFDDGVTRSIVDSEGKKSLLIT